MGAMNRAHVSPARPCLPIGSFSSHPALSRAHSVSIPRLFRVIPRSALFRALRVPILVSHSPKISRARSAGMIPCATSPASAPAFVAKSSGSSKPTHVTA
jgi:hypothetical protein